MNSKEFADKIRAKFPGAYDSIDDDTLTQKVIAKYPDYASVVDTPSEEPSKLGSFARGVMSGIPGAETAVSGIESLVTPKTYEEAHKGLEEAKDKDWDTNPWSYGAGKTTGIVGTGLVAPEGIPAAVGVGALSGLDAATTPSEFAKSGIEGAATGGILGTVGEKVVSPVINKITEKLPGLAKGALASLGSKTSTEDIQNYLNNPEAIRKALSQEGLGNEISSTTNEIGKAASQLSGIARESLNPENAPISLGDVKPILSGAAQKYLTSGVPATSQDETAVKIIMDQYDKLMDIAKANNGSIPETELRNIIDRLQNMANFNEEGNVGTSLKQKVAGDLQYRLKDILKETNPEYAEKMAPSAEAAQLSSKLKSEFNLENGQPTDTTANKLNKIGKEGKFEGEDLLNEVQNLTGKDLNSMVENSRTKANFEAPGAGKGLRALLPALGYGLGRTTGVPFGGIIGAGMGHFASGSIDGGQVAKKILDAYIGGNEAFSTSALKPLLAKYGPVLINAAKVGGNQLAATHFVLATSDPEYQKLTAHAQNNIDSQANNGIRNEE